ncbi:MAG: hypothetical protein MK009_10375 [Gammaproteobacteria bacterium]|nr:hypothetical protein [Gammaproteobacteria bacterium]
MATNFPGSLDTATQQPSPSSTTDLDATGYEHDVVHTNHSGALIALETKLGATDSNASANAVLVGTGSSATSWTTTPTISGLVTCSGGISAPLLINAQTGTTYTFVLTDGGKLVTASNGSAQTYTVPPNSSVAFPTGTTITIIGIGAGKVTLAQGSGGTINSKDSEKAIDGQHASVTLIKTATDTWQLIGALQA